MFVTSVHPPCWHGSRRLDPSEGTTDHKNNLHRPFSSITAHAPYLQSSGVHISNLAPLSHLPHTLHPGTFPAIEK